MFPTSWRTAVSADCLQPFLRNFPRRKFNVLAHWLRHWESPLPIQDLRPRPVESHHVIPTRHNRNVVRNLAVAATKVDDDGTVLFFMCSDIVERVGVLFVGMEITLGVINAD